MGNLLIVDDSAWMARAMQMALEQQGHTVLAVGRDGREGIELYHQHRPDVVLLDITMPNMDGRECLETIRKLDDDAKVVMVSAVKEKGIVEECLSLGAIAYLEKPIQFNNDQDLQRLYSVVDNGLARTDEPVQATGQNLL